MISVDVQRVEVNPDGSVQLVFMHPLGNDGRPSHLNDLPIGHVIPLSAFHHRAVTHGYDHESDTFVEDVVRHCLHEAHTPAPAHVVADPRYRYGEVFDLAAADNSVGWNFTSAQHEELHKVASYIDGGAIVAARERRSEHASRRAQ